MAQNVEIKARIDASKFELLRTRAAGLATKGPIQITQTDTFFACASGRLKLREFGDATAELIAYQRPDTTGPKTSNYVRSQCDAESMKEALHRALGTIGVVKKSREVFFNHQTRIHLDRVEGLGTFLELEVVLESSQGEAMSEAEGQVEAEKLMAELGVEKSELVSGAYFDLLA